MNEEESPISTLKPFWKLIVTIILAPIIINYGLLSWSAPYVSGTAASWLAFFGSYIGILGAISIAMFNFNKQREKENRKERENNRSYIALHDFHNAQLKLGNVKTHENSRIIETQGYSELVERTKGLDDVTTSFLKISHFGNPELIFNCRIVITAQNNNSKLIYNIDSNIGVVEKGIEIFVPVVNQGAEKGDNILLDKVTIDYSTLSNERLRYEHSFFDLKETMSVLDETGQAVILHEFDLISSNWIYPNKLIKDKK